MLGHIDAAWLSQEESLTELGVSLHVLPHFFRSNGCLRSFFMSLGRKSQVTFHPEDAVWDRSHCQTWCLEHISLMGLLELSEV